MENKHFKEHAGFSCQGKTSSKKFKSWKKKKKANIVYLEDGMYNSSHETESLSITTDDHNGRLKHYGILSTLMGEDF